MLSERPMLRYHGGKWKLAPWLISHFPPHRIYVEAFAGAASVLIRKPRTYGEIFNDLDSEVVNVFRVLQEPSTAAALERRLILTPFARDEFRRSYEEPIDNVDRAAKMIIRSFMGFGSASMTRMHITGFRSSASRCGSTPAQDWAKWPESIQVFTDRFQGVCVENRDAIAVMAQHDSPSTLHYVDPPYVTSTRSSLRNKNGNRGHYYRHDMTDTDHERLAEFLRTVAGMVVVSGYDCPLYRKLFDGWIVAEKDHMADGARPRREIIWMNSTCATAQRQERMFA